MVVVVFFVVEVVVDVVGKAVVVRLVTESAVVAGAVDVV